MAKVKTIQTSYLVKVNNDVATIEPTLKAARTYVKTLAINDDNFTVNIIKQTVNETLLDVYETKTTKILVATELDSGLEERE